MRTPRFPVALLLIVLAAASPPANAAKERISLNPVKTPTPEFPADVLGEHGKGEVELYLNLSKHGEETKKHTAVVIRSTDSRLASPVVEAIKGWELELTGPDDQTLEDVLLVRMAFDDGKVAINTLELAGPLIPPKARKQVRPDYPRELIHSGNIGKVLVGFFVDTEGKVRGPQVIKSTHPAFEAAAIAAILKWKFTPGTLGGNPVPVPVTQPLSFSLDDGTGGDAYKITKGGTSETPETAQPETMPKPVLTVSPVHPFDFIAEHKDGSAKVRFLVGPDGSVLITNIVSATEPEFGLALAAAIEAWTFEPAMRDGEPVPVVLAREMTFKPGKRESPIDPKVVRLAQRIQSGKAKFPKSSELDKPLRPRFVPSPVFPAALRSKVPAGTAEIAAIVDREGRVLLPRIVSASAPEFGWAAATAAQRWLFEPPTVGGKPVEVRCVIPFKFGSPEQAAQSAAEN